MRVIVTNDDGIDAPGIQALRQAAAAITGLEVCVVAPSREWSSSGHALTTGRELTVQQRDDGTWVVDGSPADCVRAALTHFAPGAQAVLSGINHGGNLGADIWCSGTIAAAREGALHGVRGIAFSHYLRRGLTVDWQVAGRWVSNLLPALLRGQGLVAVNLPHIHPETGMPRVIDCPLDPSPLPLAMERSATGVRYCGDYHRRSRKPGHDVAVCFDGAISVVELG
jgi:5'-nucleotidase